MTKRSDTNFWT